MMVWVCSHTSLALERPHGLDSNVQWHFTRSTNQSGVLVSLLSRTTVGGDPQSRGLGRWHNHVEARRVNVRVENGLPVL